MRAAKLIAIAVLVITLLLGTGWYLRDSIIERISNPLLEDYDIELVDVSLDALATNVASISYLELVHAKGTTIVIEDLTLPTRLSANQSKTFTARKVSIATETRKEKAPFELARLMNQFLSLPNDLAGSDVRVAEFQLSPYPIVRDLHWIVDETEQAVALDVVDISLSTTTTRISETDYDLELSIDNRLRSDRMPQSLIADLEQTNDGISISGTGNVRLRDWQSLLRLTGVLPSVVELESGQGELHFNLDIPLEVSKSPSFNASIQPTTTWRVVHGDDAVGITTVDISNSSLINAEGQFPKMAWSLQQESASLVVSTGEWQNLPIDVREFECQSAPTCRLNANVSWDDANMPIGAADKVVFSALLDVSFPLNTVQIDVTSDAALEIFGFSSADIAFEHVLGQLTSTASMQYADDDWALSAQSIDLDANAFELADGVMISVPLFLEDITVREEDSAMFASTEIFGNSIDATANDHSIALPGIAGQITLQDQIVDFDLATLALKNNGKIIGQHDLNVNAGHIEIANTAISIAAAPLTDSIASWLTGWQFSAGELAFSSQATWVLDEPDEELSTSVAITVDQVAGSYADTAFAGLSAQLNIDYNSSTGIVIEPFPINVALVDIGFAVEAITANLAPNVAATAVGVSELEMKAFNGVVTAAPFSFHTGKDVNNITIVARDVDLTEMLTIEEFAAIDVTGTIGAVLPVTISKDGISIMNGEMIGEPPGGVIRYLDGVDPNDADASSMALVTAALSHFEYDSLDSEVTYAQNGDLKLQMRISGRNPDMDGGRPIVLNLGVENNVPQMLKSLQAARAVEDILEKQLAE